MLKTLLTIGALSAVLTFTSACRGQALPTAVARGNIQAGVGWSYVKPDYGTVAIQGVTAYGDFDFLPHFGVEAEYHYISLSTPTDLGEDSFLFGPRYYHPRGRITYFAKVLVGTGNLNIQNIADNHEVGSGTYLVYGAGAGVDYRATKHLFVRGQFEYQHWDYRNGLTPLALTGGFGYRFR